MDNGLVVKQGNGLVEAAYSLSLNAQRVLAYTFAQAQLQTNYPESKRRIFSLSAKDFSEMFGVSKDGAYKGLSRAVDELLSKPLMLANIPEYASPFNKNYGFEQDEIVKRGRTVDLKIPWFKMCEYNKGEGIVRYELNDRLDHQVFEIVGGYTLSQLSELKGLTTSNAMRLYTWLCRVANLNAFKQGEGIEVEIEIEWIIERLQLPKSYWNFKQMCRRFIEPAVEQINANTNLSVTYTAVYDGRFVGAVKFYFIDEKDKQHLPKPAIRPRLPRRPKVTAGSHEEGQWATKGIRLLTQYEIELSKEGKRLELKDVDRLIQYYQITGDTLRLKQYQSIALARRAK